MPLFHSNALMAGWAPALAAGATMALRERFSASQFLIDVRRYGVTYFNYVGKPLSYILATPEHPDDADNTLRRAFGNEAAEADVARFAERFGCTVQDAYGSTEGGATVQRTPDTPRGALGRALPGTVILDPDTGEECPRAVFDENGRLLNAEEAIGEMVSQTGAAGFEGYWHNAEAESVRLRNGWYWTGDLAYRDEDDFFYFGGRDVDWLRVDGENFAAAPVEAILQRHPDVVLASVYAVPDTVVGDQVMAIVLLRPGTGPSIPRDSPSSWPARPTSAPSGPPATSGSPTIFPRPPPPRCSSACCATRVGAVRSRCGGVRPRTVPTGASRKPTPTTSTGRWPSADRWSGNERERAGRRTAAGSPEVPA